MKMLLFMVMWLSSMFIINDGKHLNFIIIAKNDNLRSIALIMKYMFNYNYSFEKNDNVKIVVHMFVLQTSNKKTLSENLIKIYIL